MRYDVAFIFVNHLFIGPVQCMATVYFLWEDYGYSSLGGIGVVVLLAVLQSFQSRIFYMLRMMTAKRSDSRIRVIDEMINSMKAIKIYCWENYFAKIIQDYRTKVYFYLKSHQIIWSQGKKIFFEPLSGQKITLENLVFGFKFN